MKQSRKERLAAIDRWIAEDTARMTPEEENEAEERIFAACRTALLDELEKAGIRISRTPTDATRTLPDGKRRVL
jgi:hypothetical protein